MARSLLRTVDHCPFEQNMLLRVAVEILEFHKTDWFTHRPVSGWFRRQRWRLWPQPGHILLWEVSSVDVITGMHLALAPLTGTRTPGPRRQISPDPGPRPRPRTTRRFWAFGAHDVGSRLCLRVFFVLDSTRLSK